MLRLNVVDPDSVADTAEIKQFALRYSRFEHANALYRTLASASL